MANSMATLSRRLYRSLLSNPRFSQSSMSLCTNNNNNTSSREDSDFDVLSADSDTESPPEPMITDPVSRLPGDDRVMEERLLENGLDAGVFKVPTLEMVLIRHVRWKLIPFFVVFLESSAVILSIFRACDHCLPS